MKLATFSLVAAALAAPAFAGGLNEAPIEPVIQPAPAPVIAPTGTWTGGYVGATLGYGDFNTDPASGTDINGGLYGLQGGYDYDFGQFVLGGSVDYNWSGIDDGAGNTLDNMARLRVRGGYDMGNALVYATAGAAYADATVGGTSVSDTGWTVGLGTEYKVTPNMSVGGEVNYHQFNDFDGSGVDVEGTSIEAKVNYRF